MWVADSFLTMITITLRVPPKIYLSAYAHRAQSAGAVEYNNSISAEG